MSCNRIHLMLVRAKNHGLTKAQVRACEEHEQHLHKDYRLQIFAEMLGLLHCM